MKIDIAKIDIGVILSLEHKVWKGYNFNDKNVWIDETELNRMGDQLFPFCLNMTENVIIKVFEACPSTENRMLISRGIYGSYLDAFLLVGDRPDDSFLLEKFKTIELIDDSNHDWLKIIVEEGKGRGRC